MTSTPPIDRRTALKLTAGFLGAGALSTTAIAREGSHPWQSRGRPAAVDIVVSHDHDSGEHGFDLSTTEVAAGWQTFRLHNETEHTHFAYFAAVPEEAIEKAAQAGVSVLQHYVDTITKPFQFFMDAVVLGREPNPGDLYTDPEGLYPNLGETFFPSWFSAVQPSGGPGLTSPGETATTTMSLDPGQYIVECYVKDADNDFHSYHGMLDLLTVTDEDGGRDQPTSTLEVAVSTGGIGAPTDVRPGRHTVAVTFQDQQFYEHLLGHDVHLVRLDDDVTPQAVSDWMSWMSPTGLLSDGTEPGTFLGGVETMLDPSDLSRTQTAYLDVVLTPGEYAWVAEVPDPLGKGLLAEFTVANGK